MKRWRNIAAATARTSVLLMLMLTLNSVIVADSACAAEPPEQAAAGPGGSDYAHGGVTPSVHGAGGDEYWLFEPADPTPLRAPVVVFLHGWGAMSPNIYGAWIEHLVRRGNVVVFPRYQADWTTDPRRFTPNTVKAVQAALATLRAGGHVKPDDERFGIMGHSVGGLLSANLAALAAETGLPVPRAVLSNQPGIAVRPGQIWGVPMEDLSKIPRSTLLVTTAGDRDTVTGDGDARWIIEQATRVPPKRKALLVFQTDIHGWPWLVADHSAPAALKQITGNLERDSDAPPPPPGARKFGQAVFDGIAATTVNALDYWGYWALGDRLLQAGFTGQGAAQAVGRSEAGRAMGAWSNGRAIKPLRLEAVGTGR